MAQTSSLRLLPAPRDPAGGITRGGGKAFPIHTAQEGAGDNREPLGLREMDVVGHGPGRALGAAGCRICPP